MRLLGKLLNGAAVLAVGYQLASLSIRVTWLEAILFDEIPPSKMVAERR